MEDWILWAGGFVGVLSLLAVLLWRGGARVFPWLAASCAFQAVQSVGLYGIHLKCPYRVYFWTYWYGQIPEQLLLLTVICNLAVVLYRANGAWQRGAKETFFIALSIALLAAVGVTWLSEPQSSSEMVRFIIRMDLLSSILKMELAAAVIVTGIMRGSSWTTWTKGLAVGMLILFPVDFAVEVGHTYFGDARFYNLLVHVRGYAEFVTLTCWIVTFHRKQAVIEPLYAFGQSTNAIFR